MNLKDAIWQLGELDVNSVAFAPLLAVILREMCIALGVDLDNEFHPRGEEMQEERKRA
jgi:hypothetical protein